LSLDKRPQGKREDLWDEVVMKKECPRGHGQTGRKVKSRVKRKI